VHAIAAYCARNGFETIVLSPYQQLDPLELEWQRRKFDSAFYTHNRRFHRIWNFSFLAALARQVRRRNTCVIVEHPGLGAMVHFLSRILRFPYILDEHTIRFTSLKLRGKEFAAKLFYPVEKFLWRKAAAVLVVAHHEGLLIKARTGKEPLLVPNGVDIDRFAPREKDRDLLAHLGLAQCKIVLFSGNFDLPLNARAAAVINDVIAPKVYEKRDDVRFVLVGKNPPHLNYHPSVMATGYVRDKETYIGVADLVIAPFEGYVGTRPVILEAMASGKTVISSFLGAKGLAVENGREIVLCAINDFPARICAHLDGAASGAMPPAARVKALDYDWELILNPLKKFLNGGGDDAGSKKT